MGPLLRTFLKQVVQHGALEVETVTGARFTVGDGTGDPPAIRFADRGAARQLVLNPALAFGELFMEGRLVVTRGSIYDVLSLASSNLKLNEPHRIAKARTRLRTALRGLQQRNSERRAKRNVAHHYDLDGRLYDLFLDPDRHFCAYFERRARVCEAQFHSATSPPSSSSSRGSVSWISAADGAALRSISPTSAVPM
jgi:cyclopropane-fatty-acyl-phospholipid synthase